MKPSKKRKSKKKRKPSPDPAPAPGSDPPKEEEEAETLANGRGGGDDERERALGWLTDAFSSVSVDQIDLAYREAGGDPFRAAGILGAQLDDPGEGPPGGREAMGSGKGFGGRRKQRRFAVATGMVSDVIGKGYSGEGRRNRDGTNLQSKGVVNRTYSVEEAEQFLCLMLGDESELGMGVVRDVLGQCGCDIEKALEALLDISASSCNQLKEKTCENHGMPRADYSGICPEISSSDRSKDNISSFQLADKTSDSTYHLSEKGHGFQPYVGHSNRDHAKVLADCEVPLPSKSELVEPGLQQMVLESLFNVPSSPQYEPNCMSWKKVVKKVESFGQGLEFFSSSSEDTQSSATSGKEDDYQVFRSVSKKHWDMMRTYYQKATIAYSRGERAHASYLSEKGKFYRDLAREADEKASREIFEARNKHIKNMVTIDLHGQHVKQAIELLKLHLLLFAYIPSVQYLKVITGCGADGVGKGKLKRSVLGLVEKEGIEWSEENEGTLILRLDEPKEYSFVDCDSDAE